MHAGWPLDIKFDKHPKKCFILWIVKHSFKAGVGLHTHTHTHTHTYMYSTSTYTCVLFIVSLSTAAPTEAPADADLLSNVAAVIWDTIEGTLSTTKLM